LACGSVSAIAVVDRAVHKRRATWVLILGIGAIVAIIRHGRVGHGVRTHGTNRRSVWVRVGVIRRNMVRDICRLRKITIWAGAILR